MRVHNLICKSFLRIACVFLLSVFLFVPNASGQSGPLSLAEVLTGLQSKSGGFTLTEKNAFITQQIQSRGITFNLSSEIESELRRAGASAELISAVRSKTSSVKPTRVTNPNAPPVVEFDTAWVDYNVVEEGVKGMRVHTKFTLKNLKDVPLQLTVRVQKDDGDTLSSNDPKYRNKGGQLAAFKALKPGFPEAVYKDLGVFIPYTAFKIEPGKHNLKLDADIIYPDGDLLKHLTLYPFVFTQPARTSTNNSNDAKPTGTLDKMWIDYNVTQNGEKGMLVHTKMNVSGLLDQNIQLALVVEKADGTKIIAKKTSPNRSINGHLTFYKDLVPQYASTVFNDVQIFIPYSEITVPEGNHNMRIHADILQPGTDLNIHINYHEFSFRQTAANNYY